MANFTHNMVEISRDSDMWNNAVKLKVERAVLQAYESFGWSADQVHTRMDTLNAKRATPFHDAALRSQVGDGQLIGWQDANGTLIAYAVLRIAGILGQQPLIAHVSDVVVASSQPLNVAAMVLTDLQKTAAEQGAIRMQIEALPHRLYDVSVSLGAELVSHTCEFKLTSADVLH